MVKTFCLRVDLESENGIRDGVPKLLDLLKKHNFKASFYLVMGGESNLIDLVRYRKKLAGERKLQVFSPAEKIRMLLFPVDFVGKNYEILKRILAEGHELGIHGWKHRAWARGLDIIDINDHIERAVKRYEQLFGKKPVTFAAPAFNINLNAIKTLEKNGFRAISDLNGKEPFFVDGARIMNVPVTIKADNNSPLIEHLVSENWNDQAILEKLKEEIQSKNLSVIYIHDLFECRSKINLLSQLFDFLMENNIKVKTIEELSKK